MNTLLLRRGICRAIEVIQIAIWFEQEQDNRSEAKPKFQIFFFIVRQQVRLLTPKI